jgi:hypothetical protein
VHVKGMLSLGAAAVAAAALVSASGAGTSAPRSGQLDLSTRAKVVHYLRAINVNPRGAVIQRGTRNYAGPHCPGAGWTCTSTAHPVVQIAPAGGKNDFRCSTSKCTIVQVATTTAATNTAKCVKTTGVLQACLINQSSSSANNVAIVVESANATGLTQLIAQGAVISQRATGASNSNTACVLQTASGTGSTSTGGSNVTVKMETHQGVGVVQNSAHGGNTVQNASAAGGGTCMAGALTQSQTLTSNVNGTGSITQRQNALNLGPNVLLDIEQNQGSGFFGTATGPNIANFTQTNTLTAAANTPVGPVNQTQSSLNGGILARVNQDSRSVSTANATQTETQCEDAHSNGSLTCDTATPDVPGYSLTQTQFGPVRKGGGDSVQTGNAADTFTINQSSTQDNDTGNNQTNVVQGDCHTPGNCTVAQETTVNGQTTVNAQSGQNIDTTTNCTGSDCNTTCTGSGCSTGNANVLVAGTGDFGNTEPNDNLTVLLTSVGYSVTESPALPADLSNFGQVWWVDTNPPTSAEQTQLISFAESGKGVFLTGENDGCCSSLNAGDQSMVNSIVTGSGITVGGQNVCCAGTPVAYTVNSSVVGNLATQPHIVTSWTATFPGGISGMPDSSLFAYYQPGDLSTRQDVAAAWDRSSTVGSGRLVVFMDINWAEAAWRGANWSDVAQNVAFFLSGLNSPPSPPVTGPNAPTAGPLFAAPAKSAPGTASSGASSTK